MASKYDLVVVGTGWYGLIAAKTYIELHPGEQVILLEAEDSVGGVWSKHRLYPQLVTQNMLETYEYPGYPMSSKVYGVKQHQHIPGTVVHQYLTDYARQTGLYEHIKFSTRVESLEETTDHEWIVMIKNQTEPIRTKRIILATGLTSRPNFPQYPGAEDFQAPYFHSRDFARNADSVEKVTNAVVVGSAKSAFDVAYAYAVKGAHVDLVVRKSGGKGPVWMAYPWLRGLQVEKVIATRVITWFSPCPFGGIDGWGWVRSFLHGTRVGRFFVNLFWGILHQELIRTVGYKNDPEIHKLQPEESPFWMGANLSVHNYEQSLFDMMKSGRVQIHVDEVDHLTKRTVHLKGGRKLPADTLVCCTGWKKEPPMQFLNMDQAGGQPLHLKVDPIQVKKADDKILELFPRLRTSPIIHQETDADPLRLYRYIVPCAQYQNHNIACAGFALTASTPSMAAAQALWISAYFDNRLDKSPATNKEVIDECLLHTQWGKWRYPYGAGSSFPDFMIDAVPYIDLLLNDLALNVRRKPTIWKELFQAYGPQDFKGIVDEWAARHP